MMRQYAGTDYCWNYSRKNVRSDDCCYRLRLQLEKHQVPVKRFALFWQPWEEVDRYIVNVLALGGLLTPGMERRSTCPRSRIERAEVMVFVLEDKAWTGQGVGDRPETKDRGRG
eukprot:s274_g2.t1